MTGLKFIPLTFSFKIDLLGQWHFVLRLLGCCRRNFFVLSRVSSETSFVSKQLTLEPKLVSALSETRRLFRLFRFNIERIKDKKKFIKDNIETGSFGVSKQPKQRKDQPKQQEIC